MSFFFSFSDKALVPMQLFVLAVTLAVVGPRMPFDRPWTIGGELSHDFRRLLLVISGIFIFRNGTRYIFDQGKRGFYLFILASESNLYSFLTLLTPYLLRLWMSDRMNVPGGRRPGRGLEPWVYATIGLSAIGWIAVFSTGNDNWWIWKKMADVLSFFPVRQTLVWYNTLTTSQALYPKRGSVLSQVVMVGEYYAIFSCCIDITSRILLLLNVVDQSWAESPLIEGIHNNSMFAMYMRIFCHSILLNVLDETYNFRPATTDTDARTPPQAAGTNASNSGVQNDNEQENVRLTSV